MTPDLPESQPLRVLIADDHELFARTLAEMLDDVPELDVVARAADGAEAVYLASIRQPDVVVMDVSMPRLDGIDATSKITEKLEGTRVVMLSALTDGETAFRARMAGAAAYLCKGCPFDELIETVREAGGRSDRLKLLERLSAAPAIAH